jgi:hypothetical protein
MQTVRSPEEVAELEIALDRARRVPAFRNFLLLCWGLITAKCLLVQWAILTYHPPINGILMVWVPSFLIFGLIAVYYARRLFRELPVMPLSGRVVSATWIACVTAFAVLVVAALGYEKFTLFLLPAFAAVLLGVGSFIQSVTSRRHLFKAIAIGWWLAALWLFNRATVDGLPWMSLFLVLFQVIPYAWLYLEARRAARQAAAHA